MKKLKFYLGYFLILLGFVFVFLHYAIRASDGIFIYDIWGLRIPQPNPDGFFIPYVSTVLRIILETFSIHGLVGIIGTLTLFTSGFSLIEKKEGGKEVKTSTRKVSKKKMSINKQKVTPLSLFGLFLVLLSIFMILLNFVMLFYQTSSFSPLFLLSMLFVFLFYIPIFFFGKKLRKLKIKEVKKTKKILLWIVLFYIAITSFYFLTGEFWGFSLLILLITIKFRRKVQFSEKKEFDKNFVVDHLIGFFIYLDIIYIIFWGIIPLL
jgi:hypothetical protein